MAAAPSVESGSVTILDSIVAANSADTAHPDVSGAFSSLGNNLIGDASGSTSFSAPADLVGTTGAALDPKLGPLQNNGGPTPTMALLSGSPAIGKGTSAHNAPTDDQRGAPRHNSPDIGAYEIQTLNLSAGTMPAGAVGAAYHQTLTAGGGSGTINFAVTTIPGSIPGLNIPSTGTGSLVISGTPTAPGTVSFTVVATDATGASAGFTYFLTVNPAVTFSPDELTVGTVGTIYNQAISATGGSGDKTLTVSNVSGVIPGLTVPTTGISAVTITGNPTAAGTVTFTVTATDTAGSSATHNYTLTVNPALGLTPSSLPSGIVGAAYSQTISSVAGVGTKTLTVSQLSGTIAGLTIPTAGTNSLLISGTPTATGSVTFTVTATDTSGASVARSYALTVNTDRAGAVHHNYRPGHRSTWRRRQGYLDNRGFLRKSREPAAASVSLLDWRPGVPAGRSGR